MPWDSTGTVQRFPYRAGAVHHKFVGRHPQVTFQGTGILAYIRVAFPGAKKGFGG